MISIYIDYFPQDSILFVDIRMTSPVKMKAPTHELFRMIYSSNYLRRIFMALAGELLTIPARRTDINKARLVTCGTIELVRIEQNLFYEINFYFHIEGYSCQRPNTKGTRGDSASRVTDCQPWCTNGLAVGIHLEVG